MNGLFQYGSNKTINYLKENAHENGEVEFLKSIIQKGMTAVDVGSHSGLIAMTISKNLGIHGKLICFEPVGEYLDILEQNLSQNKCENVKIVQSRIGIRISTCCILRYGI